ncbi:MAG TPA: transglycosylase domain-containing protein [Actinomycetes bacterium]
MAARPPTVTPSRSPLPSRAARHAPPPERSRFQRILRWALWLIVPLLAIVAGSLVGLVYAFAKVPVLDQVPAAQTTVFLDRKGAEIATLSPTENRRIVPLSTIPKNMQLAVLAAEDRDFYKHGAISYKGMLRATLANLRNAGVSQGGSTITQQYVKNAYPSVGRSRNLFRKLKEAVIAVKLEKKYTKDQILGFYLNTVYFGRGAYGVDAASRTFFKNRPARKLTLAQSALLAATIRAPEFYSKKENFKSTKIRRDYVLRVMQERGWITEKQATGAINTPVHESSSAPSSGIAESPAPYFLEKVRQYLLDKYGATRLAQEGFRVQTTIDLGMQKEAEQTIRRVLDQTGDPKASLVALDPKTGAVRAMYGGKDFAKEPFNYATDARRQAGSTMKPFVLEEALNEGYSVNSVFPGPNKFTVQGHEYSNFGTESFGPITLMDATRHSVNTVYVQLIEKVGPQKVADLAMRTGLSDTIEDGRFSPERKPVLDPKVPLALGASDVSTLQLASAYGTWANQGVHHQAYLVEKVTNSNGRLVERHQDPGTPVVRPNIANTITAALRGVVEGGTATAARLPDREVAGKTGTTSNSVDARFVGYDANLVTSVWMGYENKNPKKPPKRLTGIHGIGEVTGGSLPAVIWRQFMEQATANLAPLPFPDPTFDGIVLNPTTTSATTTTTTAPPPPPPTVTQPTFPPQTTQPPLQPPSSTFGVVPSSTLPGPGGTNQGASQLGRDQSTDPNNSG